MRSQWAASIFGLAVVKFKDGGRTAAGRGLDRIPDIDWI
jgi:hypothetical protein